MPVILLTARALDSRRRGGRRGGRRRISDEALQPAGSRSARSRADERWLTGSQRYALARLPTSEGIPFVELSRRPLDPDAVRAIPFDVLEAPPRDPVSARADGLLHVAVAESSPAALAELRLAAAAEVALALAPRHDIAVLLHELGRGGTLADEELRIEGEARLPTLPRCEPSTRSSGAPQWRARATCISSRTTGFMHVRFRIDGVVQEQSVLPPEEVASVIARMKVLGEARSRRAPARAGRPLLRSGRRSGA